MKQLLQIFLFIKSHPLASKNKFAAYWRFISWQIKQFVSPGDRVCQFVEESKLFISKGMKGATGNIYCGLLEFEEMAFVLHLLRPGELIGDIGANVGAYTILAAKNAGARVIALEPGAEAFERLRLNVEMNKVEEQSVLLKLGASSKRTKLAFTQKLDAVNHVTVGDEVNYQDGISEICVKPLNEIFKEEDPVLLKIDVEGYEYPVLKGAGELLASDTLLAVIIELNGSGMRYGFKDNDVHELLAKEGFLPYQYEPFSRRLIRLNKPSNFNTLYLRNIDVIKNRLESSRKFKVIGYAI